MWIGNVNSHSLFIANKNWGLWFLELINTTQWIPPGTTLCSAFLYKFNRHTRCLWNSRWLRSPSYHLASEDVSNVIWQPRHHHIGRQECDVNKGPLRLQSLPNVTEHTSNGKSSQIHIFFMHSCQYIVLPFYSEFLAPKPIIYGINCHWIHWKM